MRDERLMLVGRLPGGKVAHSFGVLLMLTAAVAIGCDGAAHTYKSTVTGTVTIGGELAPGGTITFHPVDGGKIVLGTIHADGSYSLRTGQGNLGDPDGGTVPPGEYIVTVNVSLPASTENQVSEGGPPHPGPKISAAKYLRKETSGLRFTVEPGSNVIVLELERAMSEETEGGEAGVDESETTSPDDVGDAPAEGDESPDEATSPDVGGDPQPEGDTSQSETTTGVEQTMEGSP